MKTTKTETISITLEYTLDDGERIMARTFHVALPADSPMTDFSDVAHERLCESYPDAEVNVIDEL
jgi:succinylarginine dihydrolase